MSVHGHFCLFFVKDDTSLKHFLCKLEIKIEIKEFCYYKYQLSCFRWALVMDRHFIGVVKKKK